MFFNKFPHRSNFSFVDRYDAASGDLLIGDRRLKAGLESFEGNVHRIRVSDERRWAPNRHLHELSPPPTASGALSLDDRFGLTLAGSDGRPVLGTPPGASFGVCGESWLFCLDVSPEARFFGMGEKNFGRLELSGLRTKFWNTDVWGDFHFAQWLEHTADPPYLSVPYVIVRDRGAYVGILNHSTYPAFFETPGTDEDRVFVEWQKTSPCLVVGAEGGEPDLWIIHGPDLRSLTRKLQMLVGTTPLPPLWALGYHQSRWGYAGEKDLLDLDRKFAEAETPCNGLWLDIDYMDGYRVFTTDREHFPNGVKPVADKLAQSGRRIVAILDPGVKSEAGYPVFDDGVRNGVFCQNPEGGRYIGMVWPGETVFPDFTLPPARDWWAGYVRRFAEQGFGGAWLDMNDPSTGPVDPCGMRFANGREPHAMHRNQYALGMQMASRDGFLAARPNERPFLLSRSGFTGTGRYSAIWTGDNVSNYFYLRMSIPTTLNLSLSGIPFNGPDLGGFGGDAQERLMVDWIKCGFLFPFARNHTGKGSRFQEPWAFSAAAHETITRYVRLRYKLLPYLYNLFCDQEELGDPILRPLFYDVDDGVLEGSDNQFMVGPSILQAPILEDRKATRSLRLPGAEPWFDAMSGDWTEPGKVERTVQRSQTPLFVRNGSVVPMLLGTPTGSNPDLRDLELHVFAAPGTSGFSEAFVRADDGLTFNYQRGERSKLRVLVEWDDEWITVSTEQLESGYGELAPDLVLHAGDRKACVNGRRVKPKKERMALTGRPFGALRVPAGELARARGEGCKGSRNDRAGVAVKKATDNG